ncbi:hypothetical protein C5O19_07340 [Siphonobacter curvatus]|uniref:Uncharacterized protein n=1 Tax=Siphonobacter curvatus TaxID=2094562 RepID=A0A2S7IP20_9BACT|nr:hypothetical protein C5O19_07340 [Siphonobacter curvatus]
MHQQINNAMHWPETLLQPYSSAHLQQLVEYIGQNPARFAELFTHFHSSEYRIAQRASRVVDAVVERHPALLIPHLETFFRVLSRTDVHPAVRRNSVRMLQFIAIPEAYHGIVVACCFECLNNPTEPAAIKAFSLTVLHRMVQQYSELTTELQTIIEDRLPYESPAFRSRAVKILRQLKTPGPASSS